MIEPTSRLVDQNPSSMGTPTPQKKTAWQPPWLPSGPRLHPTIVGSCWLWTAQVDEWFRWMGDMGGGLRCVDLWLTYVEMRVDLLLTYIYLCDPMWFIHGWYIYIYLYMYRLRYKMWWCMINESLFKQWSTYWQWLLRKGLWYPAQVCEPWAKVMIWSGSPPILGTSR